MLESDTDDEDDFYDSDATGDREAAPRGPTTRRNQGINDNFSDFVPVVIMLVLHPKQRK